MSAASVVADLVVGGVEALLQLRASASEAERAKIDADLARVRAALEAWPVREDSGTWDDDEAERLRRG